MVGLEGVEGGVGLVVGGECEGGGGGHGAWLMGEDVEFNGASLCLSLCY